MHRTAATLMILLLQDGVRSKNPGKGQSIKFVSFPEHLKPSTTIGLKGDWSSNIARASSTGKNTKSIIISK